MTGRGDRAQLAGESEKRLTEERCGSCMKRVIRIVLLGVLTLAPVMAQAVTGGEGGAATAYFGIRPPIIVNIADGRNVRFMQIGVQFRVREAADSATLELHGDAIRHELLMLFSSQQIDQVTTVKGKEVLRQSAIDTVKQLLRKLTGKDMIDEIYFTSFIIQ